MTQPVLSVRRLRKAFGATQALDDVNLDLAAGTVHALLGANGSGKSTLVKILAGVEQADEGQIETPAVGHDARRVTSRTAWDLGLRFVHQDPAIFPELSVTENLVLGRPFPTRGGVSVDWGALKKRAAGLIDQFSLPCRPEDKLARLRPAERTMVAIARALQDESPDAGAHHILVLDEPTAALPAAESRYLLDRIRGLAAEGSAILYITHRLQELDEIADHVTVLRDGHVVMSQAHHVEHRDQLIEQIAGRPLTTVFPGKREAPYTEALLRVEQLSSTRLEDLSFTANAGEVLGVAGFLGSGRSHLLGALFGVHARSGTVSVNGTSVPGGSITSAIRAGITLVPEDRSTSGAFLGLSVADNLTAGAARQYWNGLSMDRSREARDCDRLMAEHSVKARSRDQFLGELSGGNQQKVVLARWMRRGPKVLLLDEPTQGVDAGARREIYHSIRDQTAKGATAVVVSSDFDELANLCDRVLVLAGGRLTAELLGDELTAQTLTRLCFEKLEGHRR